MIHVAPSAAGLSDELGWGDAELDWDEAGGRRGLRAVETALLVGATSVYFGAVWLVAGLAPLPLVASRFLRGRSAQGWE